MRFATFDEFLNEKESDWQKSDRINREAYEALEKKVGKRNLWNYVKYQSGRRAQVNWNAFWSLYMQASSEYYELVNKENYQQILDKIPSNLYWSYSEKYKPLFLKIVKRFKISEELTQRLFREFASQTFSHGDVEKAQKDAYELADYLRNKMNEKAVKESLDKFKPWGLGYNGSQIKGLEYFYDSGIITFDRKGQPAGGKWSDFDCSHFLSKLLRLGTEGKNLFWKVLETKDFEFPRDFFKTMFEQDWGGMRKEDFEKFLDELKKHKLLDKFFDYCLSERFILDNEYTRGWPNMPYIDLFPEDFKKKYLHKYRAVIHGRTFGV